MNKRELAILEKAFSAEIESALDGSPCLIQTKSTVAKDLVERGYLREVVVTFGKRMPVTVRGYALTAKGHMAYCITC